MKEKKIEREREKKMRSDKKIVEKREALNNNIIDIRISVLYDLCGISNH